MALAPRTRLGPYEIVSLAGAGGMGEVYRARDTRLGRTVAIKVIGSAFGNHPEMRQRFQQEGQFVAQLDHPHIAALYDVGHDGGVDYLVMEFLEGKSLATRIARGPLPFGELVGYAIEIAAALAYAHARGVVHRDLKPANILVTYSGIKIIDFGLGKLRQSDYAPSSATAAMKTTPMPPPVTEQGVIPGTAAYMSPERLQGLDADGRSDIFAFGAILYEMATGRRPFDAPSSAALIADILMRDPQPIESDRPLMGDVDWIVQRCLKKNPDERWQSAADVEAMLKRIASSARRRDASDGTVPQRTKIRRLAIGAAAMLILITGLAVATRVSSARGAATAPLIAVTIPPPPGGGFTPTDSSVPSPQFSVSPDGSAVAFVAAGADGVPQLWLRRIDAPDARPLPGTADATYPFWAATGRSIAFFADGALKRLDIHGGTARSLAPAPHGRGGAWSADDVILFSPDVAAPVFRVNADGTVAQQTTLATTQAETSHRWPQFLPDGKHFIYFAHSTGETQSGIYRGSLDRSPPTLIVRTDYGGVYARPGHLLYVADDVLVATPFDEATGRMSGSPVRIVDGIATSSNFYGAFSASTNGVLAYATKAFAAELVWMGRDGKRLSVVGPRSGYVDFRLSPDGRYLAIAEVDPHSGRPDLRLADNVRGTNVRLTTSPADDASPVWSPDGARIVFRSNRERVLDLYMRSANAGGADELFLKSPLGKTPTDWSRTGDFIVYQAVDDATRYDIWAAPLAPPHTPRPLVRTPFDEMQGQVSPDGRWLAYTSNQSSRLEVYVQPLENDTRRWQVSVDGGSDPRWRRDGKELFYLARDGRLMAVDVTTHPSFDAGPPRGLFRISDAAVIPPYTSAYDVDAAGQRFLVRVPLESLQTQPLTVFVNWSPVPHTSH